MRPPRNSPETAKKKTRRQNVCPLVGNVCSTSARRNILLLLKRTPWKNIEKHSKLLASPSNACAVLSSQPSPLQPVPDDKSDKTLQLWANTDHKSRENQDSQSQPHTAVAVDKSATSENSQPNATSSTRETDYRSVLMGKITYKEKGHVRATSDACNLCWPASSLVACCAHDILHCVVSPQSPTALL